MPFPILPAATIGGGMLLNHLFPEEFGGRTQYQGVDPRQFKDQLTIDDGEIAGIRGDITRRATAANAGNRAAIKQRGAAGRLPQGAIMDALAGESQRTAEAVSSVEPKLQGLKKDSFAKYLSMVDAFMQNKGAFDTNNANSKAAFYQQALGGLGKLLLMWQGGYFDNPLQKPAQQQLPDLSKTNIADLYLGSYGPGERAA